MARTQNITKCASTQQIWHTLALLSLLTLAFLGRPLESQAGWITCPPALPSVAAASSRGRKRHASRPIRDRLRQAWCYGLQSWPQPCLRSLLLATLWTLGGKQWSVWIIAWPWALWLWQVIAMFWPELRYQSLWRAGHKLLWQGQRVVIVLSVGLVLKRDRQVSGDDSYVASPPLLLALGCQHCGREGPWVEVQRDDEGSYLATLCGHFTIRVPGDHPFRVRMLMLFVRLLDVPDQGRGSRRTRDGRTPFVRQVQAAEWFGVAHPNISRVEGYWHRGDWPELFSQFTPEILTPELVRRVATVCATFPHWNQDQVYEHLQGQNVPLSHRQVRQAIEQSGWSTLRQELRQHFHWTKDSFHLREEWIVQELLHLVQQLQTCLETDQPVPVEEQIALADVQTLAHELGIEPPPTLKPLPWLLKVEQVLFGQWALMEDDTIACPTCQSTHVARKSRTPRMKKYYDAEGNLQEIPVYRYYCRNPACSRQTFTHLPPGLVPYSRHRLAVHLMAVQAYSWSYSTYRRVGQALQVSEMTVYRWVSAWGYELLPVAAIFGLVRSSGVVGVDEKYVLVPKNDKPEGKMRRWMYVYLAVDVHTYDLLHIAIYPHNTRESAHVFLVALRAKGYQPKVIVTDLRRDYGPLIAQVFPEAQHHECVFHAEQEISRYLRDTFGRDYAEQHPEAEQVRAEIVRIFQASTKQMANDRYWALLARRKAMTDAEPAAEWLFAFLEQHWPYLVNSVENDLIPATNNVTEMVIRRFDQHYQNFCGFESIETARVYLGVFEKIYRFTPFSDDAQPRIRGKSPLQLAGYDLGTMPMNCLCRGYCFERAVTQGTEHVPNL
jgi:transposase-like protein